MEKFQKSAPVGARVIDANGLFVMPGGIDPHTHLEMPFMGQVTCDDFYSGQAAALAGGTTMHIDFALPTDGDLLKGFEDYKEKAKKSCMDYGFHMAVTSWNTQVSNAMEALVRQGINSFKFFMAYKGSLMVSDDELLHGLEKCKTLGAIPMVHAENGDGVFFGQEKLFKSGIRSPEAHALSRPVILEAEATSRALKLAEFIDINQAKLRGNRVIGEPLIVGLAMNGSKIKDKNFTIAAQYVMSPPIRSDWDKLALQQGLSGGILDLVATDHAVFNSTQKSVGKTDFRKIPNGVNGIEERLHVLWDEMVNSKQLTPMDFVRVTSTQAAKIFNLYPQKGALIKGADADIIIFDPDYTHTISAASHHSRMDTNIYEGKEIKGKVIVTISRGRVVWKNEKLNVQAGTGRFIPMPPFPYLFNQAPDQKEDKTKQQSSQKDELLLLYFATPVARKLQVVSRRLMMLGLYATIGSCIFTILLGTVILFFAGAVSKYSPSWRHLSTPLEFDYRSPAATARVELTEFKKLPDIRTKSAPNRKLKPSEKIDIHTSFWVSRNADDDNSVFHVRSGLFTANESLIEESLHIVEVPTRTGSWLPPIWNLMIGRSHITPWLKGYREIHLTLFERYKEKEEQPLFSIMVTLERRFDGALPAIVQSQLKLVRELSLIQFILLSLRRSCLSFSFWTLSWIVLVFMSIILLTCAWFALSWLRSSYKETQSVEQECKNPVEESLSSAESTTLCPESLAVPQWKNLATKSENLRQRERFSI
eukprot:g1687.t1